MILKWDDEPKNILQDIKDFQKAIANDTTIVLPPRYKIEPFKEPTMETNNKPRHKIDFSKDCLFIGGPADGQYKQVDTSINIIKIPHTQKVNSFIPETMWTAPVITTTYEIPYKRYSIIGTRQNYYVYVCQDCIDHPINPLEALLMNYKKIVTLKGFVEAIT